MHLSPCALAPAFFSLLTPALLGQVGNPDWRPTSQEVVLSTDFSVVQTSAGPRSFAGGVFLFHNVTIPRGVRVRGVGRNPLVIIASGRIQIDGTLSVRGGDGQSVNTLNSANFPSAGGQGNCGGGDGGQGSPNPTGRSFQGGTGFGAFGYPGVGGQGGRISCTSSCRIGSGGGGGAFATLGDPDYKVGVTSHFVQPTGTGGYGCSNRTSTQLPGGAPGWTVFRDGFAGNDFFGLGADLNRQILVRGELPVLIGGSGGGGGGDYAVSCNSGDPNFYRDEKGGGGGGGGGVLILAAAGDIVIGADGRVDADGGHGGGGAWAGSNNHGGGGGGGSGGFVALWTQSNIDIHVQGETYANNDYRFPVSADGGVSRRTVFAGGLAIGSKYSPVPHNTSATLLDGSPTGGFGGMGIVQFMTRPGRNADGTNTILDDRVVLRNAAGVLPAADKIRYLGWRGMQDASGDWKDDAGNTVRTGIGDFRPRPVLLPSL